MSGWSRHCDENPHPRMLYVANPGQKNLGVGPLDEGLSRSPIHYQEPAAAAVIVARCKAEDIRIVAVAIEDPALMAALLAAGLRVYWIATVDGVREARRIGGIQAAITYKVTSRADQFGERKTTLPFTT